MRVLVTGAGGFVGSALVRRLLAQGTLGDRTLTAVVATDLQLPSPPKDPRLHALPGDLAQADHLDALFAAPVDTVFHLASIPGGLAEQQPALARRVNVEATLDLIDRCRQQAEANGLVPRAVFASTIAVYGSPLPALVDDATPLAPQMSYGAQKWMGEIALADASRRGWTDGVSLRLPGVLARPPAPTGQLSAFLSDGLRALSRGQTFTWPTSPEATTWASSLPTVLGQLLHAAGLDAALLPSSRALLLPTQHANMAALVDAVGRAFGTSATSLVTWAPDEHIERLFGRFPPLQPTAAARAGFVADADLVTLVRRALTEI